MDASNSTLNAMDRARPPSRWRRFLPWVLAGAALCAAAAASFWLRSVLPASAQRVLAEQLTIAPVVEVRFDDYVPMRARVAPLRSVFLDATEGGHVERLLVADGTEVQRGQPLMQLANVALQLDVIAREAQVTEQLTALRTLELSLQNGQIERANARADIEHRLVQHRRDLAQQQALAEAGFLSPVVLTRLHEDFDFQSARGRIAKDNERQAGALQAEQLAQIRRSSRQLQQHLRLAQRSLDALTVRAPTAGRLTAFTLQEGQNVARGARIGQIDSVGEWKLNAGLDQFYLGRVVQGQTGTVEIDGAKTSAVRVTRIDPQIENGQFRVELDFVDPPGANLRRGQTLQARLTLGEAAAALVLPNGAFLQDSAGAHVFVVSADSARAVRRAVQLGRRNPQWVEVRAGLQEGERVVVSSYAAFGARDDLLIAR